MNNYKIAFIICTNNDVYYEECTRYISELKIPEGYETDVICIREADNILQGYNAGMEATDARYKVYLHQDTFIVNEDFLTNALAVFKNHEKVGMLGMIGTTHMPANGNCYLSWNVGKVAAYDGTALGNTDFLYQSENKECVPVEAIDGMLMMTQYDLPWREDILSGWDFYDISQSIEMRKHGYEVVVPYQESEWCYHDNGVAGLARYDMERHKMVAAYPEIFKEDVDWNKAEALQEELQTYRNIRSGFATLFETENYRELAEFLEGLRDEEILDTQIREMIHLIDIYQEEEQTQVCHSGLFGAKDWEKISQTYQWIHFVMIRLGYKKDDERYRQLYEMLEQKELSVSAVQNVAVSSLRDGREALQYLIAHV